AIRVVPASGGAPASVTVTQTGTSTAVITSQPPATSAVVDGTSALTEILGAQSGGALDVSGIDWSGAGSLVTKTNDAELAGQGTLDPSAGTGAGSSAYDFLVDSPIDFTRFDLTAAPYPIPASSTEDYSDFSLQRVAHNSYDFVL
ncbi:hypothetical protein, partial [Microvirga aerophila]|uniref:hypothetical protein n=1 Tax=Microvirga aerophila TaxID=670291 RepID=UPI001AEEC667